MDWTGQQDRLKSALGVALLHVALAYLTGRQMPIPLWFIPMIAVYYVVAPVFVWVDRRPKWYAAIAPLLVLASFSHRPQHQTELSQSLVYFLPVYLSGMAASHYREAVLDNDLAAAASALVSVKREITAAEIEQINEILGLNSQTTALTTEDIVHEIASRRP